MAGTSRSNIWDVWQQIIQTEPTPPLLDEESSDGRSDDGDDDDEGDDASDIDVPTLSEDESDIKVEETAENETLPENVIVWSEIDQNVIIGDFTEPTGPIDLISLRAQEISYFKELFTDQLINKLVEETNSYAHQKQVTTPDPKWRDTNHQEMSAYLGILILMGIIQVPDYKFLWSNNKYLANAGVKEIMPVRRYEKMNQYLHVNSDRQDDGQDKLSNIRPLIDSVSNRCLTVYKPPKNQCIDEGMIANKGRFSAKQYMPSKPVKWGIKV